MAFDILIKGGTVIDGTESGKRFRSDVGVVGDRITAVEDLPDAEASVAVQV